MKAKTCKTRKKKETRRAGKGGVRNCGLSAVAGCGWAEEGIKMRLDRGPEGETTAKGTKTATRARAQGMSNPLRL